jgi:hypothetical protein
MKTLKYISILLVLSICVAPLFAVDVETVLAKREYAATLPPSDSVILYHGTTYTMHNDGRMDRQEHIIRYLRNLNAWDEYCDPHLAFDSGWQELDVQVSRSHVPDGRKVDTTPNGFNPIVPFGLDRAPDFTSMRQMVVTLLGIEHDVVTELKYVISDTEPLFPWSWGEALFGTHEPTLERQVIVRVPQGADLLTAEENGIPAGVSSSSGDWDLMTWTMTDLPSYDLAEAASKSSHFLPRISFSTCPSWDVLTHTLEERFNKAANACCSFAGDYKDIGSEEVKLDSAITFIKDRIALKRFDHTTFLLKYRPGCKINRSGYGSPADLAVFYKNILGDLGFAPEVYLQGNDHLGVPGLTGREHYMVRLNMNLGEYWVDPTSEEVSHHLPESAALLGVSPAMNPMVTPDTPVENNRIHVTAEIAFDADGGAEGWLHVKTAGQLAFYETARSDGAEDFIEHWTGSLFATPELHNARILHQQPDWVEGRADLSFEPVEDTIDGMIRIELPWNVTDFHGLLPRNLALHHPHRNVPVFLDHVGSVETNLTFTYPEEMTAVLVPEPFQDNLSGVSFNRQVIADEGSLTIHEKAGFKEAVIPAGDWDGFRQLLLTADLPSPRTLLLKTEK